MVLIPANVPDEKQLLLRQLVAELRRIPGVCAVVLGGSYARGVERPGSDLDVGLYYQTAAPFAIESVRQAARLVAEQSEPVVTSFYEWGPWVNGGAWIYTRAGKVDFLYRNIDQVQQTITDAQNGIMQHDYSQQPAYGFYSVIYLAETAFCVSLWDDQGVVARLKAQVTPYPPKLQQRVIADHLWSGEFSLLHARDFAAAGDLYNTVGCLTRVAASLTQVLFALNERYFISDKKAMQTIATFSQQPADYPTRLAQTLAQLGEDAATLGQAVARLTALWQEVAALAGERYQPRFQLK
jgi:predicted nucleotidyltransferase